VSTVLHATVYMFLHNFLNVLVQIANKMGLQKKQSLQIRHSLRSLLDPLPKICGRLISPNNESSHFIERSAACEAATLRLRNTQSACQHELYIQTVRPRNRVQVGGAFARVQIMSASEVALQRIALRRALHYYYYYYYYYYCTDSVV
jgi:hypothetical protein